MNLRFTILILPLCLISSVAFSQTRDTSFSKPKTVLPITKIEMAPQYPRGMKKAYEYIAAHFKYPKGISPRPSGKIVLSFVVDEKGSIKDVVALETVHPLLDEEAIRVIQEMPRWTPGIQNGRPVKVSYRLPITMN
jgi:protein TonB